MDTELSPDNATSYSDISTYARCPKSYEYRVVQRLQAKKRSHVLWLGSLVHQQLQAYYSGDLRATRERQYSEAEDVVLDDDLLGGVNLVDAAGQLVDEYVRYREDDDWTVLTCEEQYIMSFPSGRVISFTPDLVVEDRDENVWIVDHKTTSNAGPRPSVMEGLSHQPLLYLAGVSAVWPKTTGFVFNYIRKKLPTMPRLTKQGRVADLHRVDTTARVLRHFLHTEAPHLLEDPEHVARMHELENDNRFFWRKTVYYTPQLLAHGIADTIEWLESMEEAQHCRRYPRSFNNCESCEFASLCHAEMLELPGVGDIRTQQYEPRQPKNVYVAEGEDE
jgi:hypothetical protein